MKEATGELNMTVISLVAIAAVGALFYFVIWPVIQGIVMNQTCSAYGSYAAVKVSNSDNGGTNYCTGLNNDKTDCWACCKTDSSGSASFSTKDCIVAN